MSGAAKGGSSRLLTNVWALACAWLIGSLIGLGACVGMSTFHRGIRRLLASLALFAAQMLVAVADALRDHPVIGIGVLVGGIVGIIWGRSRS
jgi:hypothetical protein